MIIHSSDVHPRYLRIDKIVQKVENPLIIDHKEGHKSRSNYSDLMAQISPFAAIAAKNTEVAQAFNNFIMKLNEFKIEINQGMPSTIPEAGRLATIASKNVVLGGKPKLKQIRHCSICNSLDHNKASCPYRK